MVERGASAAKGDSGPDPLVGRVINDKFKVLSFIAKGGMGKVYRAEQAPLGRVCALKVLNANYSGEHDPEFHKRFFLEASMTSKLRHPNTVTIFDYGQTTDGIYYMAMEYLEGYTLHRAIRQVGHLPEERTAHIARQISRSLREAHVLGVVHRDLKPANVYLLEHGDEPDYVKVLDFGLVKDVSSAAEELTQAGLFMGSPKYMAPEQIQGNGIDARTDIYALGIIMYEMITGKVPFDAPKSLDILMAHVRDEVPPIRKMNPAARVSPAMEEAIFRAIAKDPNDRFRSMDEVLTALKHLGPVTAPDPSSSLTVDHPSQTGSGPSASRIVRGAGAALAVPTIAGDPAQSAATGPYPQVAGAAPVATQQLPAHTLRIGAVLLGALAICGGIAYAKLSRPAARAGGPTGAQAVASPPPAAGATTAVAAAAAQAAPSAAPSASVAEVDFFALSPAATAAKPAAPPQAAGGPAAAAKPKVVVTTPPKPAGPAPAAPAPATAAKPAADCNPSYYYDADGNKHFKPECFGH